MKIASCVTLFSVLFLVSESLAGSLPAKTPDLVAKGKAAFSANCAICHGAGGQGDGPGAMALNPKPRNLTATDLTPGKVYKQGGKPEQLFNTISNGLPNSQMPPFGQLPEQDRWGIVYFIRTEFQKLK